MAYLLDANVFIQAKNLHYGMDFCPAFWEWLIRQNTAEQVFSIEKVADELLSGDDELSKWVAQNGDNFFLSPDNKVLSALQQISEWVMDQKYAPAAVSTFFQVADYYLVAHALGHSHVVVTHEIPSVGVRKVKIPNVCIGLKIKCMTPYEMLRKEKARFVLGHNSVGDITE
jgi:hypothetical protein